MVPLTALWMPILLSAVIVFIASSIMHMLPYHRSDYQRLPDEDKLLGALRRQLRASRQAGQSMLLLS